MLNVGSALTEPKVKNYEAPQQNDGRLSYTLQCVGTSCHPAFLITSDTSSGSSHKDSIGRKTSEIGDKIVYQTRTYSEGVWNTCVERLQEEFMPQNERYGGFATYITARKCVARVDELVKVVNMRELAKKESGVSGTQDGEITVTEAQFAQITATKARPGSEAYEKARKMALEALAGKCKHESLVKKYKESKVFFKASVTRGSTDGIVYTAPFPVSTRTSEADMLRASRDAAAAQSEPQTQPGPMEPPVPQGLPLTTMSTSTGPVKPADRIYVSACSRTALPRLCTDPPGILL